MIWLSERMFKWLRKQREAEQRAAGNRQRFAAYGLT